MISFPHAKINLGLAITEKRPDGFHNIESVFYPVPWKDILEVIPSGNKTAFTSSGITIPGSEEDNLCLKAYTLLKEDFDIPEVQIHLHKIIPIGAGLGGGSSDAAFTIKMLNKLFSLGLSSQQMKEYARQMGSDCAFFIEEKPLFCYEKGDKFAEIPLNLSGHSICLVYPDKHVSTGEAYSGVVPKKNRADFKEIVKQPISCWSENLINDFEKNIFNIYPELKSIKKTLVAHGYDYVSMSGSGSTIFGISAKNIEPPKELYEQYTTKSYIL